MPRRRAQARHPRTFSCPIRVHSWFKHCLDYVFAYSCPFVVLPLHPPSCFFVYFVLFVVQTLLGLRFCIFVSIRVHSWFSLFHLLRAFSCPFVSIRGSNTVWTTFFTHLCPFVSVRVHSWFSLFTLLRAFRVFRVFRGLILPSPFSLLVQFFLFSKKST